MSKSYSYNSSAETKHKDSHVKHLLLKSDGKGFWSLCSLRYARQESERCCEGEVERIPGGEWEREALLLLKHGQREIPRERSRNGTAGIRC